MFAYRIDYIDGVVSLCLQDTSSKSARKNDKLSLALFRKFKELYPNHSLLMEEWRRYRLVLETEEYLS